MGKSDKFAVMIMSARPRKLPTRGVPVTAGPITAPDGTVYTAGTEYVIPVDGRYWADFDRSNPIDAAVRGQAWTGVAHALIAELGVGTVTAQALTMGLAITDAPGKARALYDARRDRVPIPPVPTSGRARREEIERRYRLLPDDLFYDPKYAPIPGSGTRG